MTWWERAACIGVNQNVFFPRFDNKSKPEQRRSLYDAAKAICARCDVVKECLAAAMKEELSYDRHGVRGGLSPEERTKIARGRRSA